MTPQEQADLDQLKADNQRRKNNFFELTRTIVRADERQLETMGMKGKTKGEAVLIYFTAICKDIDKAMLAHFKKWPDK